ncbi:MAG: aminoglycoside phosphotransferase family protein [Acidimicrobiales bacterium]|nr:aminoglycoside phosphotransferase family protein [Acidimicrobiales bacterium]
MVVPPVQFSPAPLERDVVLSPEWLTHILGVPVTSVTEVETLTTVATKIRFRVTYDGPSGDLPEALCVKAYLTEDGLRYALTGQIEVGFYTQLAPLLDLRVPRCLHAAVDADTGHGLVLMADLVEEGARFLTALSPYSVDQCAGTLEQLAKMHSVDVATTRPNDDRWLAPRLASYLGAMDEERLQAQLDDGRAAMLAPENRDAARLRAAMAAVSERAATGPLCYVHCDAHAGNLYLDAAGQPGLVDWQMVQRGGWQLDVAYHLAAVLDVADREQHEQSLLQHYLDARAANGSPAPAFAEAWDLYRDALAYGFYLWAITYRVERAVTERFVERLGSAAEHHESLQRLLG